MEIHFTGHNIDVTSALQNIVEKKFKKIERHFDNDITSAHVTFHIEKLANIAEITIHVAGAEMHARAEAEDMYKAIDLMINKLHKQVMKYKEKRENHRE